MLAQHIFSQTLHDKIIHSQVWLYGQGLDDPPPTPQYSHRRNRNDLEFGFHLNLPIISIHKSALEQKNNIKTRKIAEPRNVVTYLYLQLKTRSKADMPRIGQSFTVKISIYAAPV